MNVLLNWMVGIVSQCICTSNHHNVHFKYLTILFVSYTSISWKKKGTRTNLSEDLMSHFQT